MLEQGHTTREAVNYVVAQGRKLLVYTGSRSGNESLNENFTEDAFRYRDCLRVWTRDGRGYAAQIIKLNKRGKQSAVTIHTVGKKRPNSEDQNLVPFNFPKVPHICKVPYIFAARNSDRIAHPIWAPAARMRPT